MKPQDLKAPYSFKERRPCIQDRIFYVPTYYPKYDDFTFPSWKELFGNENPVHIEYCTGNGEWVLNKARENPEVNWVAVELKFNRVRKIHSKRSNRGIGNLFIVCGEAQIFTREYLSQNCVEAIYVNFPDPWPKDRHAKHRLIQTPFMEGIFKAVKPGGKALLVSDAQDYVKQMEEEIGKVSGWKRSDSEDQSSYGTSYFERLWLSKGLSIHFLEYQCEKS